MMASLTDNWTFDTFVLFIGALAFIYLLIERKSTYWDRRGFKTIPGSHLLLGHFRTPILDKLKLLRRYNEVPESGPSSDPEKEKEKENKTLRSSTSTTSERGGKVDLASDLGYCRQRIQEFEKRLSQMNDISYIRSLEDRVNFLLVDNKRLEEERSEIEEAENDSRYLCQRLEEKVRQLKKKRLAIQAKLDEEKSATDDLRREMVRVQNQSFKETSKVSQLEGLVQSYEHKNFELEESCIEMRCTVQFVLTSMPIISSLYVWFHLSHWRKILQSYLSEVQSHIISSSSPPHYPAIDFVPKKIPRRKHKLSGMQEGGGVEQPSTKKCRNIDQIKIRTPTTTSTTTSMELDKRVDMDEEGLCNGQLSPPSVLYSEWKKTELSLQEKIQALENGITKAQEKFEMERMQLIEMYEEKLGDKEKELKQSRQWQNENQELQEKWSCLIQELKQFAIYVGSNLHEKSEGIGMGGMSALENWEQLPLFLKPTTSIIVNQAEQNRENEGENEMEMITATNNNTTATRVEVEGEGDNNKDKDPDLVTGIAKGRVIPLLQSTLKEHFTRFEWREQQLLNEIDRLMSQVTANNGSCVAVDDNMVTHLMDENQRLQVLLKDHDKAWNDLKHAQDENERLRSELSEIGSMQKKLEETQRNEGELRERLEEIERAEANARSQLVLMERKEQKGTEKIQQLREELQFLRNKCCQLQDDVDGRVSRENKYKSEIQLLISQLRESKSELEEKEAQLESKESLFQNQVQKLKAQLEELLQAYNDTECCNGMLREEISYLEKTVEEAVAKNSTNESTIASLSSELKQKDSLIEDLQSQLRQLRIVESQPTSINSPHELSDFNNSEGGLHGVVRALQEVVGLIKSCSRCENVGSKLMDIADALIPLIQTIQSSHTTDFNFSEEVEYGSMARCESDEILIPPTPPTTVMAREMTPIADNDNDDADDGDVDNNSTSTNRFQEQFAEEDDEILITRLQTTMSRLTMQISKLEENLNIRQNEAKKSHGVEVGRWRSRCEEKNLLLELLARRISHLSATDIEGHFINGILKEIRKIEKDFDNEEENAKNAKDFSFTTLVAFLTQERRRILELLECSPGSQDKNVGVGGGDNDNHVSNEICCGSGTGDMGFRVVRKIGDDALLVSWTVPEEAPFSSEAVTSPSSADVGGYEIAVNGSTYLRIPKPNRHKAVLFGLNLLEPIRLTFKCPGNPKVEESTIIFIS